MEQSNKNSSVTAAIIILLVAVFGIWLFFFIKANVPARGYQAVFLSNNQVYFGKVARKTSKYVELNDIYYLQLKQPLQNQQGTGQQTGPDLTLIKLGNELHGPRDHMEINRDHVVFIERLRDESKVVEAIEGYKEQQ